MNKALSSFYNCLKYDFFSNMASTSISVCEIMQVSG